MKTMWIVFGFFTATQGQRLHGLSTSLCFDPHNSK